MSREILSQPLLLKKLLELAPLRLVSSVLQESGQSAYLVGGVIRDCALGLSPRKDSLLDVDLAVQISPEKLAKTLARRLKGTSFVLDEDTRVYRVVSQAVRGKDVVQIDVAQIQGRDILEDLARRDFTVNAAAVLLSPLPQSFLDPYESLGDLRSARLRAVSGRIFQEDPLRMLRAFRLAAQLDLKIEPKTLGLIKAHRNKILSCAGERIRAELLGLLSADAAAPWLALMDQAGLLTAIFPELETARRCAEVYYGKGGVLKHSLDAVARLDFLSGNLSKIYPKLAGPIRRHLDSSLGGRRSHQALLRLAVLLHDVAKPKCAKRVGDRLRFFGHEARGAEMAKQILKRLRFSREETQMIQATIFHHLRPGNLAAGGTISDKAVFRFFRDLGPHGVSLLLLCWADHASYLTPGALRQVIGFVRQAPRAFLRPGDRAKTLFHLQVVSLLLDRNFRKPDTVRPERLLDGNEVMKALRLKPGPRVGEVLRNLQEAQAEGTVKDRSQALKFIRSLVR